MTINNNSSKHQRITELFDLCRQRYLEAGGNPHKSVDCQQWMSEAEKQEFLQLGQQFYCEFKKVNSKTVLGVIKLNQFNHNQYL